MPTYVYKCAECGITFERFQHFSEEPLKVCPECNGPVLRVIQPVGVIFKGSGFYVTDHKGSASSLIPEPNAQREKKGSEPPKDAAADGSTADSSSTDQH